MTDHVKERLSAYVAGDLGLGDSESVRAHLESCSECRLAHGEHARFEALLQEATLSPQPSGSLWPGVAARLHEPAPFRLTLRLAGGMAFAAAMGIVVSLTLPTPTPTGASGADPWSTLDYSLVDGPVTLLAFDRESSE